MYWDGHRVGHAHSIPQPINNKEGDKSMKLNKNMGSLDRMIRMVIAAVIALLYINGNLFGLAAIALGIFAVIFVITSIFSFCPLYLPFGLTTRKQ